jgi:ABC-type nitrate/sulfonate/bicarbonate transport system substrate-binding protein
MSALTRRRCLIGLSALPWSACARRTRPTTQVRVLALPYFNMGPLYLADESGYFAEEGLHIEIQELDGSSIALPLLAGNQADAAFFGVNAPLINAAMRGARVRIVAGRQLYSPDCPDSRRLYGSRQAFPDGFHDLRQMKGKTVCVGNNPNGMAAFVWAQGLTAAGLLSQDVHRLNLNDPEAAATLLATGKLDVLLPVQERDIGLTFFRERIVPGPAVASFLPNFVYAHLIFGKRFLDDSPADGVRFLRAYFKGSRDFLAGKTPRFLERLVQRDRLDPQIVRGLCREGQLLDGHIQFADLQRFIDWTLEQKLIPARVRAEQIADMRFLQQAHLG